MKSHLLLQRSFWFGLGVSFLLAATVVSFFAGENKTFEELFHFSMTTESVGPQPLDTARYDAKMIELANMPVVATTTATTAEVAVPPPLWPVKAPYPNVGAVLPDHRIIAYYGNLYSRKMGVLGEYDEDDMLARLQKEVKKWNAADPKTEAIPALHYIAVTAQGSPGADGMYRFRMPDSQIDEVLRIAAKINALVFLDIQVALSTLPQEIPVFEKYLKLPNVHLGIDPEFSMQGGAKPGTVIGTFDAKDVNYAAEYLARLVKEHNLPPKMLVVHRFTQRMMTNYQNIRPLPEVQIIVDMDGWGPPAKKRGTYRNFIYPEPVQFTGFKLFYKNDIKNPGTVLMTPEELLTLTPRPSYIQYQ